MKLFVDDCRPAPAGWVLARTPEEARIRLEAGSVEEVSLDYFIGTGEDETFLSVAHVIVELPAERRPRRVVLHTASEAGAARLAQVLRGSVPRLERASRSGLL